MKDIFPIKMTREDVKILNSTPLHQGFLKVQKFTLQYRLFRSGFSPNVDRELITRYRVGAVLLFDPVINKVVLLEQFRIGALEDEHSPWLIELVAGILTETAQESIEDLVKREAIEETGVAIQAMLPICDYWVSPGGSSERVAIYCGKVDARDAGGIHGLVEEHEDIMVHVVDIADAFAAVRSGRINNAATIIALQWLELNLTDVKRKWQ